MIRLEHLYRSFQVGDQAVHALDDISLQVRSGEYLSIMGPSGSGKSTLLNMIGLLDRPDRGHYWFDEEDVSTLEDDQLARIRRNKIGFVFQSFHLIPRMSAAENIELPLLLEGLEPALRKQRVATVLEAVGLADRAHHRPDQLSGGQRQRVAIARATILNPAILLADEPTGNLDQASGSDVIDVLEGLNREGVTLIMVTHDADLGSRTRRHIHMIDGRIVADDGDT